MRMTASHCVTPSQPDLLSKLHVVQRKLLAPDGTQIYLAQLRQAMPATAAHLGKFVDLCRSHPTEIDAVSWRVKINLHKKIEKVLAEYEQTLQEQQHKQQPPPSQRLFFSYHEGLSWCKVTAAIKLVISHLFNQPLPLPSLTQPQGSGMSVADASHAEYIQTFAWQLTQRICSSLEAANNRMSFVPHFVADESMRHLRHARSCALACHKSPTSRKMISTVDSYMESSGRGFSVLCVHGASGCGKTMFVAENAMRLANSMHAAYHQNESRGRALTEATAAAKEASSSLTKFKEMGQQVAKTLEALRSSPFVYISAIPAMIVRFIGLTSESSSIRNLISSICQQLHMILVATHGPTSRNIPALPPLFDLEAMKAFFNNTLRTWNNGRLIIFLDGVNHLDDSDGGRVLDWLPVDGLSAMVSFVFVHLRTW
jgi:hypothetical protein